jgi:hypothetical protein
MAMHLISLFSSWLLLRALDDIRAGNIPNDAVINAHDVRERVVAFLTIAMYITSGILFIRWFRRAYFNLHQRAEVLQHTEGWAAGSWFVPIVGLWYPYQIMRDLFVRTRYLLERAGVQPAVGDSVGLRTAWWTLWVLAMIMDRVLGRLPDADSIEALENATWFSMAVNVVELHLAVLAIAVVQRCARLETQLAAMPTTVGPTLPVATV